MKLKDVLLGIAIMVLTIFVTFYGLNAIFPKPNYDDYCGGKFVSPPVIMKEGGACPAVCVEMYYFDGESCTYLDCGSGCGPDNVTTFKTLDDCQANLDRFTCYDRYDDALKARSEKVFFVALPLGVLIIALGAFVFGLEAVGAGLMGGGVGTLIYGSGAFWPYTGNVEKFIISLIGLVVLIGFTYYFSKRATRAKSRKK